MTLTDNYKYDDDDIDSDKQKRDNGKNKPSSKCWSLYVIEGIIVLIALVAGGRFLFTDNAEVSHLQATIDAQQSQPPSLSAEALFDRAMNEVEVGLTDDAMRSLDLALELNPSYAEAYFERGQLRYDLEQYYYAASDYELALQYDYESPYLANFNLGRARFERDDYSQAIDAFNTVIQLEADDASALYWRGRSYVALDYYQDGIDDIFQAIEMGYDELAYAYFWIAKAYDDSENYDSAIQYYSISVDHATEDCKKYLCWIDYNNRGTSYHWLEDYESAIQDYTTAIQVNPDPYPLAFKNRGDAYGDRGDLTLGLSDWNTMFLLLEDELVTRSLTDDSRVLRDTLDNNDTQVHVEFEGTAGNTITLSLTVPDDSDLDAMLMLRDKNSTPLAYSAPGDTHNAQLNDIVLSETGTYTLVIASNLAKSAGEFTLRLE